MATRYQIELLDQTGARVALLTTWRRLRYQKTVNGVDTCILEIDGEADVVDDFTLDSQIIVYRRDIAASPSFDWTIDFSGFHRTPTRLIDGSGLSSFRSNSLSYEHLLERRYILHTKGSAEADKSGAGETVMKEYVNENAGPGTTSPPRIAGSPIVGLSIEADAGQGENWEGSRAFRNLLETCKDIADATNLDFEVVSVGPVSWEFRVKSTPIGQDRTTVGLNPASGLNAAGNPPIVFSLDYGNMQTPMYSLNRINESNAVIVLGQGIEDNRTVIERTDADALDDSPWNRMESVHDGSQNEDAAALEDIGDSQLFKLQAREAFTFETVQTEALLYGRDYFLGDLVTARFKDIERNKQIIGVTINVQEGVEEIAVVLGDAS